MKNNEEDKVGSLETIRYGLARAIKRYGHEYDITSKDLSSFTKSNKAFEDACAKLKIKGKGFVDSYKEIHPTGMFTNITPYCIKFKKQFQY